MPPIIGTVFQTGRIDFGRAGNEWVFDMIDGGLKESQRDRIRFDPAQAPVRLQSAPINDAVPEWMAEMERRLQTANSIYLQYRKGILRFRLAQHDVSENLRYVTLATQDEVNLYSREHWSNVRYFYALRRDSFQFEVNTMITHKANAEEAANTIDIKGRVDYATDVDRPVVVFDSTGSSAPVEVVEWRSKVREGESGRFDPPNAKVNFSIQNVTRPITLLHEDRKEFHNHSYMFTGERMWSKFDRTVKRRMKAMENTEPA